MPIYDFRCNVCQERWSHLQKSIASAVKPVCPACGSEDTTRLITSFAYHKSEQTLVEELGEPNPLAGPSAYKSPRQIGMWTERRAKELGIELPDKAKELIDKARSGQENPLNVLP